MKEARKRALTHFSFHTEKMFSWSRNEGSSKEGIDTIDSSTPVFFHSRRNEGSSKEGIDTFLHNQEWIHQGLVERKGDPYEKLKKCIQVSILDFVLFSDDKRCYRTMHFRDDETGKLYSDKMELQIMELKKLPEEIGTGEDVVKWMRFFNGKSRKEFEDMAQTDEYLGEAYEALKKLSADERKRLEYEAREKALRDYNSQINSAEKRGELKKAQEDARNFYNLGVDIETIAQGVGYAVDEVKGWVMQTGQ